MNKDKIDIFIRSYSGDFKWLKYALMSIDKFCTGFRNIVIVVPDGSYGAISSIPIPERIRPIVVFKKCPNYQNDYQGQQYTKMTAHHYTDADAVLFTDSDTIFIEPTSPGDFMEGDLIWAYKTPYDRGIIGEAMCWKEPTEKALGFQVQYEYMRRLPMMYRTDTLARIERYMDEKNTPLESVILEKGKSEFNILGAFADAFEKDKYIFLNTEGRALVPQKVNQYWSWGGLRRGIENEIQEILK